MLSETRQFALRAHGDQKYGTKPYAYHLDAVVRLLEPYGETAQVIGYLHDVVEDTEHTVEDIAARFGRLVADSVALVSDEPGVDRAERKRRTYDKMAAADGELELALIVKTADRLANVTASIEMERPDKLKMYQQEHDDFSRAVYRPGLCEQLWSRLNQLLDT
jgi:(p)ppGpp synthase/HD superfamily hydrolase